MISIFKKNDLINVLLLLPYVILLRLYSFLHPVAYQIEASDSIVTRTLFSGILSSPIVQAVVGVILIYIQALMINQIVNKHRIYRRPSALAGMTYILIVSCFKEIQVLTPALIAMTFLILTTFSIFNTYKQANAVRSIANSAFNAALATVIYPPYSLMIIALMLGLGMLRSFDFREKLQFIISWLVGFWILGSFLFFFDLLDWSFWNHMGLIGSLTEIFHNDLRTYISLGGIALLLFIVLFNYYNYKKKKEIEIRKKIDFFYWMLLLGFVSLLLYKNLDTQHLIFISMPIAVFLSMSWMMIKQSIWAELIHLVCVGSLLYGLYLVV